MCCFDGCKYGIVGLVCLFVWFLLVVVGLVVWLYW